MKPKRPKGSPQVIPGKTWLVQETAAAYGERTEISVRDAKDNLSSLLERAANGEDIVITSDGHPKAMIVRYRPKITGKPYKPDREWLRSMPMTEDSTEMIRKMRDEGLQPRMYLDTSVLVKLFVREPDSEAYADKLEDAVLVSSELAYGELWAALLQKEKTRQISPAQREGAWVRFCQKLEGESIRLLRLDVTTVRAAVEVMTEVHPHVSLRTLDAIHLATYRSLDAQYLMTADKRMRDAARFLELPMMA